jgi:transposase
MGLEQFNTHESDARMMRTSKGPRVAYKVQTAVDAAHFLILHHEVTQDGDDRTQLEPIARAAKPHLEQEALCVTADAGYSNGQQFQACEKAAITVYVPPNRSVNPGGEEFFERKDFTYEAEHDRYQCPAGKWLTLKQRNKGDRIYQADVSDCAACTLKSQCTGAQRRYVSCPAHEEAFERMEQRMLAHPQMMASRRSIVSTLSATSSNGCLRTVGGADDDGRLSGIIGMLNLLSSPNHSRPQTGTSALAGV